MLDIIGIIVTILWGATMIAALLSSKGRKAGFILTAICWFLILVRTVLVGGVTFAVLFKCFGLSMPILVLLTALSLLLLAGLSRGGIYLFKS